MSDVKIVELIVQLVAAQKSGDRERAAVLRRQLVDAKILVTPGPRHELDAAFDLWAKAA